MYWEMYYDVRETRSIILTDGLQWPIMHVCMYTVSNGERFYEMKSGPTIKYVCEDKFEFENPRRNP